MDKGLGNSIRVPKPFTFKMKLQSKCKTFLVKISFICMRKKVHFHPYHWLFIQPCFETGDWGNLEMVHLKWHVNCKQRQVSNTDGAYQGFWYFVRLRSCEIRVNPWNPEKITETRKIPRNSVKILSNTCLYNIFETYFSYRDYLLAVNFTKYNLSWNLVIEKCKQRPETTRRRLCCEKLGTSHDIKGFAIGSFLERIVVERANDDLC